MAKDSSEMNEFSDRESSGNVLVLRLAKKEVKKEEEEQPKGIEEEEVVNGDSGQGNAVGSVSDHPSQPSSVTGIIPPMTDRSVKVEKEGDSMVQELQQLRETVVINERTLKDKQMLLSMLTAKLEEVRKEKKAGEEQLKAEISVLKETSRERMDFERRLIEEQQKNAQLVEDLKLSKEKPNNMDKETMTDMATDHSAVMVETSTTMQSSRAAIAAQLPGIDVQLLDEPQPNDWKEKFEQLNIKYVKVKKMYRTEQNVASKLRKKLKGKEKDAYTEELSLNQLGDADQQEPIESNEEAVCSPPVQSKIHLPHMRKSQQSLEQQRDFEQLPEEEKEEGEEVGEEESVKEMETVAARRSAKEAIVIRGRHEQLGRRGHGQKKPVPPPKRMEEKKGAANTAVSDAPASGVFKCSQCPATKVAFSSAHLLASHQKTAHGDRQHYRHRCAECGRRCWSRTSLANHMRTHTGVKPFKCRECGRGFAQQFNLKEHERVHTGERPHVCPVCQKAFVQKSTLIVHVRLHSGERPFSCRHCAKSFKRPDHCRKHEENCSILRARQSADE